MNNEIDNKSMRMILAFAKLEGVELVSHMNVYVREHQEGDLSICGVQYATYNPITDLALNCAARDKYNVCIEYWIDKMCIEDSPRIETSECYYESKTEIPAMVIECILKSNGVWIE